MKPLLSLALLALAAPLAVAQNKPSDWRAFRGNDGLGVTADKGVPLTWGVKENVVWKTDLPGAGTSTPIVVGDRVFVTCYSGFNVPGQGKGKQEDLKLHVVCLARATGKILWTRDVNPKLPEQDNIRDGHGYASHTPTADDDRVYAFFGKSGVVCFDHAGKELWRADVGSKLNGFGSGASLIRYEDLLIVNASVESEKLYALDAKTGKEVWSLGGIREGWNTPILVKHGQTTELVMAYAGKVIGVDPKTGKQLWNCATDIPWYMVPSLVAHEGIVYAIGGRPGGSLAVKLGGTGDVTKTHRVWSKPTTGGNVSSPVYHDGHLYWMHDNREVAFCVDAKTGDVVYEERVPRIGQVYGSPVLAEGRIYYPSRMGSVFVVAAKPKFELLATNTFGERGTFNSSPAVAGGQLFLRTDKFVCCIGKK